MHKCFVVFWGEKDLQHWRRSNRRGLAFKCPPFVCVIDPTKTVLGRQCGRSEDSDTAHSPILQTLHAYHTKTMPLVVH